MADAQASKPAGDTADAAAASLARLTLGDTAASDTGADTGTGTVPSSTAPTAAAAAASDSGDVGMGTTAADGDATASSGTPAKPAHRSGGSTKQAAAPASAPRTPASAVRAAAAAGGASPGSARSTPSRHPLRKALDAASTIAASTPDDDTVTPAVIGGAAASRVVETESKGGPSASSASASAATGGSSGGTRRSVAGRPKTPPPPVDDAAVSMLCDMGFTAAQAKAALRMYPGDLDSAAELIMSGALEYSDAGAPGIRVAGSTQTGLSAEEERWAAMRGSSAFSRPGNPRKRDRDDTPAQPGAPLSTPPDSGGATATTDTTSTASSVTTVATTATAATATATATATAASAHDEEAKAPSTSAHGEPASGKPSAGDAEPAASAADGSVPPSSAAHSGSTSALMKRLGVSPALLAKAQADAAGAAAGNATAAGPAVGAPSAQRGVAFSNEVTAPASEHAGLNFHEKWSCGSCTYENSTARSFGCVMCGSVPPPATRPSVAPGGASSVGGRGGDNSTGMGLTDGNYEAFDVDDDGTVAGVDAMLHAASDEAPPLKRRVDSGSRLDADARRAGGLSAGDSGGATGSGSGGDAHASTSGGLKSEDSEAMLGKVLTPQNADARPEWVGGSAGASGATDARGGGGDTASPPKPEGAAPPAPGDIASSDKGKSKGAESGGGTSSASDTAADTIAVAGAGAGDAVRSTGTGSRSTTGRSGGSSVPEGHVMDPGREWQCPTCTVINVNVFSNRCKVCGGPRPQETFYSPIGSESATAAPPPGSAAAPAASSTSGAGSAGGSSGGGSGAGAGVDVGIGTSGGYDAFRVGAADTGESKGGDSRGSAGGVATGRVMGGGVPRRSGKPFGASIDLDPLSASERLACLANFWNLSSTATRAAALRALFELVLGAEAALALSGVVPEETLSELPLSAYADIELPAAWFEQYLTMGDTDKVGLFRSVWSTSGETERRAILSDMRAFYNLDLGM